MVTMCVFEILTKKLSFEYYKKDFEYFVLF